MDSSGFLLPSWNRLCLWIFLGKLVDKGTLASCSHQGKIMMAKMMFLKIRHSTESLAGVGTISMTAKRNSSNDSQWSSSSWRGTSMPLSIKLVADQSQKSALVSIKLPNTADNNTDVTMDQIMILVRFQTGKVMRISIFSGNFHLYTDTVFPSYQQSSSAMTRTCGRTKSIWTFGWAFRKM